jgi:hypothetical protein
MIDHNDPRYQRYMELRSRLADAAIGGTTQSDDDLDEMKILGAALRLVEDVPDDEFADRDRPATRRWS